MHVHDHGDEMKIFVGLLLLMSSLCSAQTLKSGGVALGVPDYGAYEFILWGGGPQGVNKCPPVENGFCYLTNGGFYLLSNGRTFEGEFNPRNVTITIDDSYCEEIKFPLTGVLTLPEPPTEKKIGNALYTQTVCNIAGESVFDSGGSLVLFIPGFVP